MAEDNSIANVDKDGNVTGLGKGTMMLMRFSEKLQVEQYLFFR